MKIISDGSILIAKKTLAVKAFYMSVKKRIIFNSHLFIINILYYIIKFKLFLNTFFY